MLLLYPRKQHILQPYTFLLLTFEGQDFFLFTLITHVKLPLCAFKNNLLINSFTFFSFILLYFIEFSQKLDSYIRIYLPL